jgi:hypothetical protein
MIVLRQSTAITLPLGPFVDATDGVTPETGLSLTQAETRLSKNGGTFAQKTDSGTATHGEEGNYLVSLDATDTGTLGRLRVSVYVSGALPVWVDAMVMPANVWDAFFGTDKLEVDVTQFGGTNATTASGRPEVNTTHAAGTAWGSGAITAAAIASDAITAAKIASDAITAAKIADGAIDAATFAAGAINAAAIAADAITDAKVASDVTIASVTGAVGSVTGAVGSVTGSVGSVASGGITAASFAADAITAAKLAADVTTELQAGLATAASIAALNNLSAAQVNAEVDTALADYDAPTNAEMVARTLAAADYATAAALATVDTVADAIQAKTDNLPSDPADASVVAGLIAALPTAAATATAVLDSWATASWEDGSWADLGSDVYHLGNVIDASVQPSVRERKTRSTVRDRQTRSGTRDRAIRFEG